MACRGHRGHEEEPERKGEKSRRSELGLEEKTSSETKGRATDSLSALVFEVMLVGWQEPGV